MKKLISTLALSLIVTTFAVKSASADGFDRPANTTTGVGVILGQPTGFTGKYWIQSNQAIDAGFAFSLDNFILIYSDYLLHFKGAFGSRDEFTRQLEPYVGLGAVLFISENSGNGKYYTSNGDSTGMGIRIPLGAEYRMRKAPIGIYAEIVPGVGIIPSSFGFVQGGIGARYYF